MMTRKESFIELHLEAVDVWADDFLLPMNGGMEEHIIHKKTCVAIAGTYGMREERRLTPSIQLDLLRTSTTYYT